MLIQKVPSASNLQFINFSKCFFGKYYEIKTFAKLPKLPTQIHKLPVECEIKSQKGKHNLTFMGTPAHFFMNFKNMSGNEILLNLENVEHFTNSELVSALIEIGKRPHSQDFDWNSHPYTVRALYYLEKRLGTFNVKNVVQTILILKTLRVNNNRLWKKLEFSISALLHKLKRKDIVFILKTFNELEKGSRDLFERLVGMSGIYINSMGSAEITDLFEVLVEKNLGSERLFEEYIYFNLERKAQIIKTPQYIQNLKNLAKKSYGDDLEFWNDYYLSAMYSKSYTFQLAHELLENLYFLKVQCPQLNLENPITFADNLIQSFIDDPEYQAMSPLQQLTHQKTAEIPPGVVLITKKKTDSKTIDIDGIAIKQTKGVDINSLLEIQKRKKDPSKKYMGFGRKEKRELRKAQKATLKY